MCLGERDGCSTGFGTAVPRTTMLPPLRRLTLRSSLGLTRGSQPCRAVDSTSLRCRPGTAHRGTWNRRARNRPGMNLWAIDAGDGMQEILTTPYSTVTNAVFRVRYLAVRASERRVGMRVNKMEFTGTSYDKLMITLLESGKPLAVCRNAVPRAYTDNPHVDGQRHDRRSDYPHRRVRHGSRNAGDRALNRSASAGGRAFCACGPRRSERDDGRVRK